MRVFYTCLFYLVTPLIIARLLWRSIKAPDYRHRWLERFAYYHQHYADTDIWFHAVSVGETEALFPLIRHLQRQHPAINILITTTTPTGSARVKAVLTDTVTHVYLPYDLPDSINRFMQCFKPKVAVIVETEIWPNLFTYCGQHNIPLYVINARLSEKSTRRYQKIPALMTSVLAHVTLIATQTAADAARFIAIGANKTTVKTVGNIKFDIEIAADLITQALQLKSNVFHQRFVWVCASTHDGEEEVLLALYPVIKLKIPELLMVLVPRHPERFSIVKKLVEHQQLSVITRSSAALCQTDTDIYLADTMGELKLLYGAADVAFVGGSLVPIGGHNVLEPAAVGVPVLFGSFMANFNDIAQQMLQHHAALQCHDQQALIDAICMLYAQPHTRTELITNGKAFVRQNQGVTATLSALLSQHLLTNT